MHSESQWRQGVDCRGWVAPGWLQVQSRRGLKYGAARRPAVIAPDQCDSPRSIRMLSELELEAPGCSLASGSSRRNRTGSHRHRVTVDPRDPPGGVPPGPLRPRAGAHARCWQTVTAMLRLACHCALACAHDHANGFQPSVERRRRHAELRDAASAPGWPAASAAFGNTSPHRRGFARSPAVAQFTWNWLGGLTRSPGPGRLAPGVLGAFGVPEGPSVPAENAPIYLCVF